MPYGSSTLNDSLWRFAGKAVIPRLGKPSLLPAMLAFVTAEMQDRTHALRRARAGQTV